MFRILPFSSVRRNLQADVPRSIPIYNMLDLPYFLIPVYIIIKAYRSCIGKVHHVLDNVKVEDDNGNTCSRRTMGVSGPGALRNPGQDVWMGKRLITDNTI